MPTIGELVIDIKASTASIQTEMTKLQGTMATSSSSIVSSLNKIVTVMVVDIGQRAVRALVGLMDRTIEAGDKIGRLAQATSMSVGGFSGFAYAAKMADVDVERFATGVERLSFKFFQAQKGNESLNAEFEKFGIDPEKIRNPEEALVRLADQFAKMPASVDKTAIAIEFFGRGGAAMLPFLNLGAEGIKQFVEEARKLGLVLSQETVAKFQAAHEAIKRLRAMFDGVALAAVADVAPALANLVNSLVATEAKTGELTTFAKELATAMKLIATVALTVYGALRFVADAMTTLYLAWQAFMFPARDNYEQLRAMAKIWKDDTIAAFENVKAVWDKPVITVTNVPKGGGGGGGGTTWSKQKDEVAEIIKKLEEEAATYKMVATQAQLWHAIEAGASVAQLDRITLQIARLDELAAIYDEMGARQRAGVAMYGPLEPAAMNQLLGITQQMIPATNELDDSAAKARDTMFGFYEKALSWEEQWWVQTSKIIELWEQYPELGDLAARAIEHQTAAWDEHTKQINKVQKEQSILVMVQRDISQGLADAIFGADSFGDAMQRLLLRIAEVIFQAKVLDPLLQRLFNIQAPAAGGGGGGGLFGLIGGFFGGLLGFQGGGTFSAGQPFIAGEAGPELIYPAFSGGVIPNNALGGRVVYNIDARGADPTVEFRIRRALRESEQRSVARSVSTTREIGLRNIT